MTSSTITVAAGAYGVVTVTFNRPDKGNAFDATMLDELAASFDQLAQDSSVRIVVLRGNGRHFSTGADASGSKSHSASGITFNDVLVKLDTMPKPVIAIVHGGCVGGGIAFAACCDVVLATEDAFFSLPELRVGIASSARFVGLLARTIGVRALRYYGLSGVRMTAHDGLRLGLVHEIVSAETLDARLESLTDAFLHNAPGALNELKQTLASFSVPDRETLFPSARTPPSGLERSAEAVEGLAAFREKRKPSWYPR